MNANNTGEYRSRVYTDRPDYADLPSPEKFQAILGIIGIRLRQHPNAICSYSGGSDSDILIDIIERARDLFGMPEVKYCFFNTGLEMKATKQHVKEVAEKYGVAIMTQQQILEQARDNEWIKLENGLRKFRCGKFVIYDVDYLLKNLAEEISKLSAKKRCLSRWRIMCKVNIARTRMRGETFAQNAGRVGEDLIKTEHCKHEKGKIYGKYTKRKCIYELSEVTDVYEWAFVENPESEYE